MLVAIMKRLEHEKRGVSNVIVVMLSLVLIVVIVSNVVLWSYQMNQVDWEKMQESIKVTNVTRIDRSSWFVANGEYNVNTGSLVNGTYRNTQTADGTYETLSESPSGNPQQLIIRPNTAGYYTQWSGGYPSWQAHWSLVDEATPDDDNTYVENTAGTWSNETYNLQDPIGAGAVNWICVYIRARATSAGNSAIRTMIRVNNQDYLGNSIILSTSYQNISTQYAYNPNTGSNWTWLDLNSLQAGASSQKSGGNVRLTTVWVVVSYTPNYSLDVTGAFNVDLSTYPLAYIKGVEMQLLYRASDSGDKWYLKAYNWTSQAYSNSGFNNTMGDTPTTNWKIYAVNLTGMWSSYVNGSGNLRAELVDNQTDANQTTIDIDFLGVVLDVDGTRFSLENDGSVTSHIVAIWVTNTTLHRRFSADFFMNLGETTDYVRVDIGLPIDSFVVEVATERGNIAVFRSS
jgi:hypothetical protein